MRFWSRALLGVVLGWAVASPAGAQAPFLLTVEGSAAMPATAPQTGVFGIGGSAAVGVYRPLAGAVSLGLRLRGALLSDIGAPDDPGRVDPGAGGLASGGLALRLRPIPRDGVERGVGPFLEIGGGPALTGDFVRAAVEAGIGWGIPVGPVDVAPGIRYLHVVQPDDQLDGSDARIVMIGVELTLFDARPARREEPAPPRRAPAPVEIAEPPPAPEPIPAPRTDRDGDGFFDDDDGCPDEREVVNGVDDLDGCPDEGVIELVDDRIVIEDHVLFAYARWDVRPSARRVLEAIVELWRQHPEWARVRIEGHTDIRGNARYNQRLSEHRARAVMEALIERGMPRGMMESIGYGETRPLNRGTREATHRRNRRVEFVILEGGSR